ncbi:MAG: imidazoleglycerol-phosphate dehydratase HisB [archaeon]|nr:imidazoleglycerol-phosphate dehydratase HisB [archaeon]
MSQKLQGRRREWKGGNSLQRTSVFNRKTKETNITVKVNVDGTGRSSVSTGTNFLDHMIQLLSTHSLIDIQIRAKGDLKHHTVEDTALALGAALSEALGNRSGIRRFGSDYAPMDESLAFVSVDLVKRPYFVPTDLEFRRNYIEDLAREDLQHFFRSFCTAISCTMHIHLIYGSNDHHKAEACFKALALALRKAVALDERRSTTPSSKGSM